IQQREERGLTLDICLPTKPSRRTPPLTLVFLMHTDTTPPALLIWISASLRRGCTAPTSPFAGGRSRDPFTALSSGVPNLYGADAASRPEYRGLSATIFRATINSRGDGLPVSAMTVQERRRMPRSSTRANRQS